MWIFNLITNPSTIYLLIGLISARLLRNKIGVFRAVTRTNVEHRALCNKNIYPRTGTCTCTPITEVTTYQRFDNENLFKILGMIPGWPLYIIAWLLFTEKLIPKSKRLSTDILADLERKNAEFTRELEDLSKQHART
jgi:hypothetical protein